MKGRAPTPDHQRAPKVQRHVPFPCPACKKPMTKVIDTRPYQGTLRRRRACPDGHVAVTRETLQSCV